MSAITPADAGDGVPCAFTGRPRCRSCLEKFAGRPRGLCWRCHADPDVRRRFPPVVGARGVGNGCFTPPAAPEPTVARPGTPEKVEALAMRAAAGQSLWHPADGRI